jgi:hypothetical protein
MKTAKIFFLWSTMLLTIGGYGQENRQLRGKPRNLEETFLYLNQLFDDTAKYNFMLLPVEISTARLHHGFGTWIRNNWGLWGNSDLKKYFAEKGVRHPDEMSGIILGSYHQYLTNKQIEFNRKRDRETALPIDSAAYSTAALLQHIDSIQRQVLTFYPIGNTILVYLPETEKKLFKTKATSVKAIAIVKEHRNNKLLVEIISISEDDNKKHSKQVGDIYEVSPDYCSLLPPKGWTFKRG